MDTRKTSIEAVITFVSDDGQWGFANAQDGCSYFLHRTKILKSCSLPMKLNAHVTFDAATEGRGGKRPLAKHITVLDSPADPEPAPMVLARVIWFDDVRGFGKAEAADGSGLIFIHARSFAPELLAQRDHLEIGEEVYCSTAVNPKGIAATYTELAV